MNREIFPGGIYPLTGDVQSQAGNQRVLTTGLQGVPVTDTPPDDGQVLGYSAADHAWEPVDTLELQTNGTANGSQTKLNLVAGANITLTDDGSGDVTLAASGGTSPSGTANEVYATPDGASGAASLRALVPADLPVATGSTFGAVKPDGTTVTISGGVLSATGGSTPPSGSANEVYATPNGASGSASLRVLVPADLPLATTASPGTVKPDGSTITIAVDGTISAAGGSGYSLGSSLTSANITVGSGAGSGATATVSGKDGNHSVSLYTGTSGLLAATALFTVTFAGAAREGYPVMSYLNPGIYSALAQMPNVVPGGGPLTYTVESGTTPLLPSTYYIFNMACP